MYHCRKEMHTRTDTHTHTRLQFYRRDFLALYSKPGFGCSRQAKSKKKEKKGKSASKRQHTLSSDLLFDFRLKSTNEMNIMPVCLAGWLSHWLAFLQLAGSQFEWLWMVGWLSVCAAGASVCLSVGW